MQPEGDRIDLDLLENTATEPDTAAASTSRTVDSRYGVAFGCSVSAALTLAVVGALTTRQAFSIGEGIVSEATALSVAVPGLGGDWTRWEHLGCRNWRAVSIMKPKTGLTLSQCQAECLDQLLCGSINYQTGSSCGGEGISPGACYVFVAGGLGEHGPYVCMQNESLCWDFYARPGGAPVVMESPRDGTGCDNADDIELLARHQVWTRYECFERCRTTPDCTTFSHEPGEYTGSPNFCRLMKDGCQMKQEVGMNLYFMKEITGATSNSTASDPTSASTPTPTAESSSTEEPEAASSTTATPTADLECVVGASTCHETWTEEKQAQCCNNEEFCCNAAVPKEIFDCSNFDKPECHSWTDGQKVVCGERGQQCQDVDANAAK
mmetsp:Transcript_103909/g.271303  ORF Transcript_103909/g.271303 Transcript_103909/m.271303 type:complete len:380 (+) Transcript_103909:118-1257(+)